MMARELLRALRLNGYKYLERGRRGAVFALKSKTTIDVLVVEEDYSDASFKFLDETKKLYSIDDLLGEYETFSDIRTGLENGGFEKLVSNNMMELWMRDDEEFVIMKN